MSTATPRLQLTKPIGSESMVLGASQLSDAYSKIDAAVGVKKFATQGAATATFPGDLIIETSTNQSKLFNSPTWVNIFDSNNCKGKGQDLSAGSTAKKIAAGDADSSFATTILSFEVGRKYLINFNFNISAESNTGSNWQGYFRYTFKYTTNLAPNSFPSIFIHDVAVYIAAITSAKSKNIKGMFEFFPNATSSLKLGISGQIITGQQDASLNISGSTSNIYAIDWGV